MPGPPGMAGPPAGADDWAGVPRGGEEGPAGGDTPLSPCGPAVDALPTPGAGGVDIVAPWTPCRHLFTVLARLGLPEPLSTGLPPLAGVGTVGAGGVPGAGPGGTIP